MPNKAELEKELIEKNKLISRIEKEASEVLQTIRDENCSDADEPIDQFITQMESLGLKIIRPFSSRRITFTGTFPDSDNGSEFTILYKGKECEIDSIEENEAW